MQLDSLITDLALILIVASIVTVIFKKINLPIVLGYIVAGFLISPNFDYLPTVVGSADISAWADIGVVFLMFGLGLEFSFKKLATVGGSAIVAAMTVMAAMILIGAGVGTLFGWGRMDCIFLGGMISMSSTMIILKAYEEYRLKQEKFAQLVLSTMVIEDIFGIFMMIILSTISVSQNVSGVTLFTDIGLLLVYLAIWLVLGIYLIPSLLKKIGKLLNDEMMLIVSLAICLGMVVLSHYIGFSDALGAFVAGSILAGTVRAGRIERLVTPIKDLFGAVFFVSVGMMLNLSLLWEYIVPILIITAVTIAGQMIFATLGILLSGQSLHTAIRGGFSMVQIGEFSFIVATLGTSLGVISDFLYPVVVCVSVITTFTTPVFIKNSEKVYKFLSKRLPGGIKIFIRKNTSEDQSDNDKNTDWLDYIRKVLIRTGICAASMFIIYLLGIRQFWPFLLDHIASENLCDLIAAAVTCAFMVPFTVYMHGSNNDLFIKLWMQHRSNKLPLLSLKALRILIAACFIALVIRSIYNIPYVILVLLAMIPIIFIVRSDYLRGMTINMEMRFLANFSERTLATQKREKVPRNEYHWLDESLLVAEFKVVDSLRNERIYDFTKSNAFKVTIIRIVRDGVYINLPSSSEEVKKGDMLHMMGNKNELDACVLLLEREGSIEYTDREDVTLKDYIYGQTFVGIEPQKQLVCCPIDVESDSSLCRKSIKNSQLREKYRANVIGIERENLTTINPRIETTIMPGDIVWVIGSKRMADLLIKGDVLKNKKAKKS